MSGKAFNRTPLRLALVVLVAAAAVALAGALGGEALADIRAAWSTPGTIHARFYDPDGELIGEEWLDKTAERTRRIQYGGAEGDEITVQERNVVTSWNSRGFGAVYRAVARERDDPWVLRASSLLRFRRLLERGDVQIAGTRAVDGRSALVLRVQGGPDVEPGTTVELAVDEKTLLPVEAGGGGAAPRYRVVATELPGWSPPRAKPPAGPTIIDRRLAFDDAGSAVRFGVYLPGDSAWTVQTIGVRDQDDDTAAIKPQAHLFASLARGSDALELVERDAKTEQARAELAALTVGATKTRIAINRKRADVYVSEHDGELLFALVLERTLISGHTALGTDALFQTLQTLRRV